MPGHDDGGFGRLDAAGRALEQGDAGVAFQCRHLLGDGRSRVAQPGGGGRKRSKPDHFHKGPEMDGVDQGLPFAWLRVHGDGTGIPASLWHIHPAPPAAVLVCVLMCLPACPHGKSALRGRAHAGESEEPNSSGS
ncbi:hypothetical protein NicSoilC12_32460 [Arthrobacter sp. NicSoilC12]|nr:hypothetical protein NicSoilC12_32460 [Arthrobacter sp. NicSoilC12]